MPPGPAELITDQRGRAGSFGGETAASASGFTGGSSGTALAIVSVFPVSIQPTQRPSTFFKVHLNPEVLDAWNALPQRTRGSLEKQLQGMAKVIGFREMLTEGERYGSVRTGKVEALYELDTAARLLRVYELRRHQR
jgi:hypothetical protein